MGAKNNSSLDSEIFDTLPSDNFGVNVENDMDKRKLLWLVNQIGEKNCAYPLVSTETSIPKVMFLFQRF